MSDRLVAVTIAPEAPMLYKEAPASNRSMNRQERIDVTAALLIAVVLLILLGASIPQP